MLEILAILAPLAWLTLMGVIVTTCTIAARSDRRR
jgi:hypothetical protein